jgi:hypothetical protein
MLLDAGVHLFFVDLHAFQIQIANLPGEMPGRHLLVMLDPTRCGADLFGDISGIERLNLKRITRCHGRPCALFWCALVLLKVDRWNGKARPR